MDGLLLIPPRFLYCRRRRRVGVRLVRARGDHRRSDTGRREKGMGPVGWASRRCALGLCTVAFLLFPFYFSAFFIFLSVLEIVRHILLFCKM
jgi:hypothetical protein